MRFFLDHDVDADVVSALVKLDHDCWTAAQAGLFRAGDDELTVYADNAHACVVTHDREFSMRRKVNVVGHHIWLTCSEWDAPDVLVSSLPDILPILKRHRDVMVILKLKGQFEVHWRWK